ncbi:MAG: transcriptional regulator [Nitrososphaerota archaeon]
MSEEISLTPIGREQIHKLESALLIASIFSPSVLSELQNPTERLTWIDSLAVAAAAVAREKAKMSVSQIAEELGRTEATIRNHLQGKTRAGQIIRETYNRFLKEGVKIPISPELFKIKQSYLMEENKTMEIESLKLEIESLKKQIQENQVKIKEYEELINRLRTNIERLVETINQCLTELKK